MGFSTVYDTTILNEDPFLIVLGPVTDFWVGHQGFPNSVKRWGKPPPPSHPRGGD